MNEHRIFAGRYSHGGKLHLYQGEFIDGKVRNVVMICGCPGSANGYGSRPLDTFNASEVTCLNGGRVFQNLVLAGRIANHQGATLRREARPRDGAVQRPDDENSP